MSAAAGLIIAAPQIGLQDRSKSGKLDAMQMIPIPEKEEPGRLAVSPGEHLIGEFIGDPGGASLIVFGGVHGNEPSGVRAMQRITSGLESSTGRLRGRVFFLAGNTRALCENVRFIDRDLNRIWTVESVRRNDPAASILTGRTEDIEQRELLGILNKILPTAEDEVYAMDLHSTSAASAPFAMIGDTLRNRRFAQKFPGTFLLGIEEQLDGTILEYLNNLGAVTLGFEAGQHTDKTAVDNQEALIRLALVNSGIMPAEDLDIDRYERVLSRAMGRQRRIIEIRHRHAITAVDKFKMKPGYASFEPVKKGEVLALDKRGPVRAVERGLILMPLYQDQGSDGFFLGREISAFWLGLSKILRKLKVQNLMRFLPGVNPHPADPATLVVNTRIAAVFPLQIFHLLGFRKRRWRGDRLIVSRRKHDTESPFRREE